MTALHIQSECKRRALLFSRRANREFEKSAGGRGWKKMNSAVLQSKREKKNKNISTIVDFIFAAFTPHFQQNITGIRDIHIININANYLLMPIERFVASHRRGSEF